MGTFAIFKLLTAITMEKKTCITPIFKKLNYLFFCKGFDLHHSYKILSNNRWVKRSVTDK